MYINGKFTKEKAQHTIVTMKMTHQFALKMATMICISVVSSIILLGVFFAEITKQNIGITIVVAIILGIVSFTSTRSACL